MTNSFKMGRLPDDQGVRQHWARTRCASLVKEGAQDDSTIIQPPSYLMDQKSLPSCVGKSFQGRLNGVLGIDISGVNLWTECRAYDNNLEDPTVGTTAESAINVLLENGWTARINPNEDDLIESDESLLILPELDQLLDGDDHRMSQAIDHNVFVGSDDEKHYAILAALRQRDSAGKFTNILTFGTGVYSQFFNPPRNIVLNELYLSPNGDQGGHEQGLIGWVRERNGYLIQGSWRDWTDCSIAGVLYTGCCLVSRGVIEHAWDVDKMKVR
jgi:hypothetical protein